MGRGSKERRRRGLGRRLRRIHEGEKYKDSDKGEMVSTGSQAGELLTGHPKSRHYSRMGSSSRSLCDHSGFMMFVE